MQSTLRGVLTFSLTIFYIWGLGQDASQNTLQYIGSDSSYVISYPASWTLNTDGLFQTDMLLITPYRDSSQIFTENINLIIDDLGRYNSNVDTFMKASINGLETYLTDFNQFQYRFEESEPSDDYIELNFIGRQGIIELRFLQHVHFKDNRVYIFTFTCERNFFDEMLDSAEKIMNSITIY